MRWEHKIGQGFHRWSEGEYSPGQLKAMHDYINSFILLSGAYRSGKTEIGSRMAIRHACFFPGSKVGVFRSHLASLKKSTLLTVLELIHPSWVANWSNTDLVLRLHNESTISFIGADFSDRLGSIELTYGFIDEAAELNEESLGMIQGRLSGQLRLPGNYDELPVNIQEYLGETLDIRQVIMACNPKGNTHYLYKRFISIPQPGHVVYNSNSISNPNLPEVYLVNNLSAYVRPGYDRDWVIEQVRLVRSGQRNPDGLHMVDALTPFGQRNLLGLWVALEGAIYDMDEELMMVDQVPEEWGQCQGYEVGVDFGFHNPRIAVLGHYKVEGRSAYIYVDGWRDEDSEPDDMVEALATMLDKWGFNKAYMPHDQPGIKKVAKRTIGSGKVKSAKTDVSAGIGMVSRFINSGRFKFLRSAAEVDLAWAEMTGYVWKKTRDGAQLDQPVKEHDHFPDAFRYCMYSRHHRDKLEVGIEQPDDKQEVNLELTY